MEETKPKKEPKKNREIDYAHVEPDYNPTQPGAGENTLVSLAFFLYLNHPTKIDVTSGQIGAQQPVSAAAKSNDGVRVRHDFFGFLSPPYQEL